MLALNVSGTWKTVQYAYVNVSGSWKTVAQIYVNVSGSWKPLWSYSWSSGSWGSCSADCGGGTQTRTVTCSRNDGQTVTDSLCVNMVGSKPSTSQSCNTQSCLTGSFTGGNDSSSCAVTGWGTQSSSSSTGGGGQASIAICSYGTTRYSDSASFAVGYEPAFLTATTITSGGYKYTRGAETGYWYGGNTIISTAGYCYSFTAVAV